MAVKFLKPMLDAGSSRVFNFNSITRVIKAKDPAAPLFFHNPPLNNVVLIKDSVPEFERKGLPVNKPIGTKLYFPFNDKDVYEGGKTIFLHAKNLQQAVNRKCRHENVADPGNDRRRRAQTRNSGWVAVAGSVFDERYFHPGRVEGERSLFRNQSELWQEIETFVLQSFEPLVKAAFSENTPDFDEKAKALVEKIWEARDTEALKPLIQAFRLPPDRALEIFSAWKGVNYYSFQYKRGHALLDELAKWFKTVEIPVGSMSAVERTTLKASIEESSNQLKTDWKKVETILNEYTDGYDKMFRHKISSAPFMEFLRNCSKTYWELGNALGRMSHATYCWNTMTSRHPGRKSPWTETQQILKLLAEILKVEAKPISAVSW